MVAARAATKELIFTALMGAVRRHGWPGTDVDGQLRRACRREDAGHNDICELSLSVCLGRNFSRSGVYFGGWSGVHDRSVSPVLVPHVPGMAYIHVCQHQHGVIGPATGERHSLVVRAMSSRVRAAPAEGFAMQCLRGGG